MGKVSLKTMSLLGLVLMAASAVTAAVMPRNFDRKRMNNGTLRFSSFSGGGALATCFDDVDTVDSCTATVGTATTLAGQDDSTVNGLQTQGNTSQTASQAGDQNSVLVEV